MHRLPDGAALGVQRRDRLEDLCRAGFALLRSEDGVGVAALLAAHGAGIDDHTGQPVVGRGVRFDRVHRNGQTLEALFVALVDGALLVDMLGKMRVLSPHDAGDHVGHPVIVAEFGVLIPRGGLARLGRDLAGFLGDLEVARQKAAARGAGDDLVAVVADGGIVAEGAAGLAVQGGAHRLGGVLDQERAVLLADLFDEVDPPRESVEFGADDQFDVGVDLKRLFERDGIHVPGLALGVDENRDAALVNHGVDGGVKGHIAAKNAFPLEGAVPDRGDTV